MRERHSYIWGTVRFHCDWVWFNCPVYIPGQAEVGITRLLYHQSRIGGRAIIGRRN